MTQEQEKRLLDSHEELMTVCKAAFSILIEEQKLDMLDALLEGEVMPGFADRAENLRTDIFNSMAFAQRMVN